MEAAAVPTDGCKRERDGDDEAASKKLCKEEVSAVTEAEEGGGGKEMDTIVAETRDEDMKIHEEEVVDGKKVEPEEQEEVEKKSSNQEGDVVVPEEKKKKIEEAKVGPKHFTSSLDMLNYFHEFVRTWPLNYNVNKVQRSRKLSSSFLPSLLPPSFCYSYDCLYNGDILFLEFWIICRFGSCCI